MNRAERSGELESLARKNDWRFALTGNVPALAKFEFPKGEKRAVERIENLIEGADFNVFDVYWRTEYKVSDAFGPLAHKNMTAKNARQQTFILSESADLNLPKFHVYPADSGGWLDKVFRRTDSVFAGRWTVEGNGKDLLNEKVTEFYEKNENFWTFVQGKYIFIYQPDTLILPSQIEDWIKRILVLAKSFDKK